MLKVTANGTTTSPVRRGAWVQRKIMGRPPEPPPPNVPAVEPDTRGATTIRELLEKHRADLTPISGLHHPMVIGKHHNCEKVWLTGANVPGDGGAFRNTVSADQLIADHPQVDAAICFNDLVALGLMTGFARAGRPVGQAFRVVGFDDIEEAAQSWPPLSSVSCDIAHFAQDTAARLLAWMVDQDRPAPELRSAVRLVARASSLGNQT